MALARTQYEADGSTKTFSIPFDYINKSDVVVSVDGTETTDFTWTSNSTIKFSTAPTNGAIIDIKRETERNSILVDFQDGSTLLESDLDLSARQSFYLAQESFDQTGSTLAVANDGSYSASGRRISLLGYPTGQDNAATKQYVDDTFAQGEDAADMANESENWANYPVDSLVPEGDQENDYSALHHATKASEEAASASSDASSAASDASAASTSASNAADSESNAAASETNAANSAAAAQASEDDVAANASAAATSESNAADSEANAASSESTASNEATNAAGSASAAATSESNASQSASDASTYATNASNSADAAAASESNAANSASAAETSEASAQDSEANASDSATEAKNWANAAEDTLVPEGDQVDDYSALHWARKAEGWAAGVNMPSASGNGGKIIHQAADESGLEYMSKTQARDSLELQFDSLPWLSKSIGEPFPLWDHLDSSVAPPTGDSRFTFIKLTAGESGAGGYNEGVLANESVSGSDPLVEATAEISTGPLSGQTIHLINTEKSFLRAGESSGNIQFDQMQKVTGTVGPLWIRGSSGNRGEVINKGSLYDSTTSSGNPNGDNDRPGNGNYYGARNIDFDSSQSPDARTSSSTSGETRPKNVSATYYMRIA